MYLNIVETFPWAVISPSVHRILAHSWEKIEINDSFGFGGESEEGRLVRVAGKKGRYERNAADLILARDAWRECRISVGQRCGEEMQD